MNEQHFDALPPVNLSQTPDPQAAQPAGKVPPVTPGPMPAAPGAGFVNPLTGAPQQPVADPVGQAVTGGSGEPAIADDVDLIEKEWVERAKQIVEQTKHDPYLQNEEMTRMKLDYLKKRYNRDVKKGDSA